MYFGAAYYPEHRDPAKWEFDLTQMNNAHVNCIRVAEFAWSRFEPTEGIYDFSWLDTFLDMAWAHKIQLLICPPIRTLPAWMMENDPSLAIITAEGTRLEYGSRYSFCINHPYLREKGKALAIAMAKHYGSHPGIAGWHLDNEHGDEPDCHCSICEKKFQDWCSTRYKSIEKLNDAWGLAFWGLHFTTFNQVPTPRVSKAGQGPGHRLAWNRFRSESTNEVVALQAKAVRENISKDTFVTTNNQPLWNNRTDYFDMAKELDICGTNYYPPYGENASRNGLGLACSRGFKQQNFQVHELRNSAHMIPGSGSNTPAPGEVEKLTLHCIGNGADGIFYFRWRSCPFGCEQSHGTIVDFDGRPRRIFPEVQKLGSALERLTPELATTTVKSDVAMLFDFPTRWVMETGVIWNGSKMLYTEHTKRVFNSIRDLGYSCDVTGRDQNWDSYKVLVVPLLATVNDELADKFIRYVENGGTLIWHPLCGVKTDEAHIHMDRIHPKLRALFGTELQEYITSDTDIRFTWNNQTYAGNNFADMLTPTTATTLGNFTDAWYADTPAVLEQKIGAGRALYIGVFGSDGFYNDFFKNTFLSAQINPIVITLPKGVEACERSNNDGDKYIFLLNNTTAEQSIVWNGNWLDTYNEESGEGNITLAPHGSRILSVKK
jgi:beta-galactosidase